MHTINIAKSIKLRLNSQSSDNIFQLTENNDLSNLNPRHSIVSRNKFIKNLKAYTKINSTAETAIPDFNLEDSETEKLHKVLDVEWNSERKQLDLLVGNSADNDWMSVGETSLLNPNGYPYRIYNLLDLLTDNLAFEFGDNLNVAVKITDVGYGLLTGTDEVNIYGSYAEELVIDDSIQPITSTFEKTAILHNESIIAVLPNIYRKYLIIQNNNTHNIYISLSDLSGIGGIVVKPGGHYEFSTHNVPYFDEISIFSEYNSSVLIVECN